MKRNCSTNQRDNYWVLSRGLVQVLTLSSPIFREFYSMKSVLLLLYLHVQQDYNISKTGSMVSIDNLVTPASSQNMLVNYNIIKMSQTSLPESDKFQTFLQAFNNVVIMCCAKLTFTLTPFQSYTSNRNVIRPIGAPINLLEQIVCHTYKLSNCMKVLWN